MFYWEKSGKNNIYVRRFYKKEVVQAVKELESKGFECTAPIKFVEFQGKNYKTENDNGRYRRRFVDNFEHNYYEVYMRKVNKDEHI